MDETSATAPPRKRCPRRAAGKAAILAVILAVAFWLLAEFVNARSVNGLVNHLSLAVLVALIVAVNVISILIFIALSAAYRWIKRDLDPDNDD